MRSSRRSSSRSGSHDILLSRADHSPAKAIPRPPLSPARCEISVNAPAPAPAPEPAPKVVAPVVAPINANPTQGDHVSVIITNAVSSQRYKAGVYALNAAGGAPE